jgi:hypothetical protein
VIDTEDKLAWCERYGLQEETKAVADICLFGHPSWINPQKRKTPYVHDGFISLPLDVKSVRTPLFKSRPLYGIEPEHVVTLNLKDVERYAEHYPMIVIAFVVRWEKQSKQFNATTYKVDAVDGIWLAPLQQILQMRDQLQVIEYARRVDDQAGNARDSYVIDLRSLARIK